MGEEAESFFVRSSTCVLQSRVNVDELSLNELRFGFIVMAFILVDKFAEVSIGFRCFETFDVVKPMWRGSFV